VPFNEEKIRTTMNHDKRQKQHEKNTLQHIKKCENPARLPAKMNIFFLLNIFFTPSQTTAPAPQNARAQLRCWPQVKRNEKGKSALHPHEMQVSKMTYFLFFCNGETKSAGIYIYI
jgi:hypothetical protein